MATETSPKSAQIDWDHLYQLLWDTGVGLLAFAVLATIISYTDFLVSGRMHVLLDLIVTLTVMMAYLFGRTIETKDFS